MVFTALTLSFAVACSLSPFPVKVTIFAASAFTTATTTPCYAVIDEFFTEIPYWVFGQKLIGWPYIFWECRFALVKGLLVDVDCSAKLDELFIVYKKSCVFLHITFHLS